jgi:hypothetical protein
LRLLQAEVYNHRIWVIGGVKVEGVVRVVDVLGEDFVTGLFLCGHRSDSEARKGWVVSATALGWGERKKKP